MVSVKLWDSLCCKSHLAVGTWHLFGPSLCGIPVQDGYTDFYGEIAFKGGVPLLSFVATLGDIYSTHGNCER